MERNEVPNADHHNVNPASETGETSASPAQVGSSLIARLAAALIGLVMAFQLALILGAPWGNYTQGGANAGALPAASRLLAAVSFVLLSVMACALLAQVGQGPLKALSLRWRRVLGWLTVVYLALAIAANLASQSSGERILWAPISTALFVLALMTMIRSR